MPTLQSFNNGFSRVPYVPYMMHVYHLRPRREEARFPAQLAAEMHITS
ncbi:MAG: hypothetical protein J5I81_06375 [Nitrococcus mobilis]|nr:hypothetical protein [Nitrococcus mobilis]